MIDLGTGNNNKMCVPGSQPTNDRIRVRTALTCRNWPMSDKQELIDIIETVYRGASKGRGLVVSPRGELTAACPVDLADDRLLDASQVLGWIGRAGPCMGRDVDTTSTVLYNTITLD